MHFASNLELQKNKISTILQKYTPFFIFLFFVILTILFTFPLVLHLNSDIIGDGGDNYLYFGYQYIFSSQIKSGQIPFSINTLLRFPFGFPFYRAYDSFIGVFLGGVISLITKPILAYNLSVILLLSSNAFFSYLLFKYISKKEPPAIIGGIIYGLSFYSIGRSNGHIGLMFTAGFPFFLYAVLKNVESTSKRNIIYLCLSVLLIVVASFQYLLFLLILLLVCIPFTYVLFPRESIHLLSRLRSKLLEFRAVILPFIIFILIITGPIIYSYGTGTFIHVDRSTAFKEYSPSLTEYFIPNKYLHTFVNTITDVINTNTSSIERVSYLGIVEIILFLTYVLFYKGRNNVKKLILLFFGIFFVLSLGFYSSDFNIKLPYSVLFKIFPFSSIPEASRFSVIYLIPFTLGIVLLISSIKNRLIVSILLILIIFERTTSLARLSSMPQSKSYMAKVADLNYSGVLDIPISYENTFLNILPLYYGKPIVSGTFHWSADDENTRKFTSNPVAMNLVCSGKTNTSTNFDEFTNYLRYNNIGVVVVHKNDPEDQLKFYFPECANVRIQSSLIFPQLFMPIPSQKQHIMSLFFPALPDIGDTIQFPSDGVFFLDGFHVFPTGRLPIHVYLDGKEIKFNQKWNQEKDGNMTLDPFLSLRVQSGSRLKFTFDTGDNSSHSFIMMWYRFSTKNTENQIINGFEKIYEDDDAAVFKIH